MIKKLFNFGEEDEVMISKEIEVVKKLSFEESLIFVQEEMSKSTLINGDIISADTKQMILSLAMSRDRGAIKKAKEYIYYTIADNKIEVKGFEPLLLADNIFAKVWGLDKLEKYAMDSITDEIRVNSKDNIRIVKRGVPEKVDFVFEDEEEIETLIKRLIIEDVGVSIDKSNPKLESVMADGSRLTATCPPITKSWTFVLRRPDSFTPTLENYILKETLSEEVWKRISILAKGRASMLISGNVGAGKTTFMRKIVGEINDNLRIGVIGKDNEILLADSYPNKDIIELEEQEHLGIKMKDLFVLMLRESPDALIMEEFRGAGEAVEAVRLCTRGLFGSMATAHFSTPEEAVEGTALFMLEEGLGIPIEMAKLRVARAFNIVVQMFGNAITGKKKVVGITEIIATDDGKVEFNDLMLWTPKVVDDYFGEGKWVFTGKPSGKLIKQLLKGVKLEELDEVGWI